MRNADDASQIHTTKGTEDTKLRDASNEISREIIGAAIEVHRVLGPGYLESVYERALALELTERGISFDEQVPVPIVYRGVAVGEHRLDLLVGGLVVVEIKAIAAVVDVHYAQVLSYLKATNLELALILNFHARTLTSGLKRVVR